MSYEGHSATILVYTNQSVNKFCANDSKVKKESVIEITPHQESYQPKELYRRNYWRVIMC